MTQKTEGDKYYKQALNPIFLALDATAFITVARWSYVLPKSSNPLVFTPGGVGKISDREATYLQQAFGAEEFRRALKNFSFTKLLVENDKEIWFHFTNDNPPVSGERQVYLGYADIGKDREKIPVLEVAAAGVTPGLVDQIIEELEKSNQEDTFLYGDEPLEKKKKEIMTTLNAAIFSLFQTTGCNIKHVYFMPVVLPSAARRVSGIISINSPKQLKVAEIEPVMQPFAQGIMSPFHLQEVDERRKMFSLRSAIAAIMSRNMSHNIGSHVLWHLSQDLKELKTGNNK